MFVNEHSIAIRFYQIKLHFELKLVLTSNLKLLIYFTCKNRHYLKRNVQIHFYKTYQRTLEVLFEKAGPRFKSFSSII